MIYTKTYKNGLRLIHEKNSKDVASLNITFNVGSQNESKEQEGYSHFIEHLIFKGTKTMNSFEILDKLAFLGADYNAYTSKISTKFVLKCLTENFEKCFDIYSDMIINAEFDKNEIDRERQVVIEEMKRCDDEPTEIMYKRAMENYFSGHSFAHDELGEEKIIETVSREELLNYKLKYYKPENCVISIVGNLAYEEVDRIVSLYFADKFNYESQPIKLDIEQYKINISKKYDIIERDDNQANVCIVIKTINSLDKEKYACDLYTSILGSSQNSRLFKIIREKLGLVYSIYACNELTLKAGEMIIYFGTRPQNVKKAVEEVKKVILDFAENGATEEEFVRAKIWKKSGLSFGTETNSDIADINGIIFNFFGKVFNPKNRLKMTEAVTLEQVNNFAKRIANETTFNIVAVGKGVSLSDLTSF